MGVLDLRAFRPNSTFEIWHWSSKLGQSISRIEFWVLTSSDSTQNLVRAFLVLLIWLGSESNGEKIQTWICRKKQSVCLCFFVYMYVRASEFFCLHPISKQRSAVLWMSSAASSESLFVPNKNSWIPRHFQIQNISSLGNLQVYESLIFGELCHLWLVLSEPAHYASPPDIFLIHTSFQIQYF